MTTIQLSKDELRELMEDDRSENTESDTSWRHGSYETYVVPYNGKFYEFTFQRHTQEGWEDTGGTLYDCYEVEKKEILTYKWVQV
jgi:hypothetical protein